MKVVDNLRRCPHWDLITDQAYANLKSSLFYLVLDLLICPLVFWAKFSKNRGNFLTYENFFFLFWLIFFIVACKKAFNYRSILNEHEYLRALEFREVMYEEEIKFNRKFSQMESQDFAKRDEDGNLPDGQLPIEPKNVLIKIDYMEKSIFKEVIIKI